MKHTKYILLLVSVFVINSLFAGTYFPLQKGNYWNYHSKDITFCDGNFVISIIDKDTVIGLYKYAVFKNKSVFNEKIVRADSNKVYSYDLASNTERVVFDFTAKPGDTISRLNGSERIIIALGSMQFIEAGSQYTNSIYTVRDSLGVIDFNFFNCPFTLTDAFINGNKVYPTNVKQTDNDLIPNQIVLMPIYPNPFNSSTSIRFYIPIGQEIRIDVVNIVGQLLTNLLYSMQSGGWHQISWDAKEYSSGTYFIRLQSKSNTQYRTAVLVK